MRTDPWGVPAFSFTLSDISSLILTVIAFYVSIKSATTILFACKPVSHHPQEVLLAQFSLYVHKSGLKPDSFHL